MSSVDKIKNIYFLPCFTANRMQATAKPVISVPPDTMTAGISHPTIGCTETLRHSMTAKLPKTTSFVPISQVQADKGS